jgi:hypothetical protein
MNDLHDLHYFVCGERCSNSSLFRFRSTSYVVSVQSPGTEEVSSDNIKTSNNIITHQEEKIARGSFRTSSTEGGRERELAEKSEVLHLFSSYHSPVTSGKISFDSLDFKPFPFL